MLDYYYYFFFDMDKKGKNIKINFRQYPVAKI